MEMIMQNMVMQQPAAATVGKDLTSGLKGQAQEGDSDVFAQMMEAAGGKPTGQIDGQGKDDALIQSMAGQFMQAMTVNPLTAILTVDTAAAVQAGIPATEMQALTQAQVQMPGVVPAADAGNTTPQGNIALPGEQISAGVMTSAADAGAILAQGAAAANRPDQPVLTENSAEPAQNTGEEQTSAILPEASGTQPETAQQGQTNTGMQAAVGEKTKTESDAKTTAQPETVQFQTAAAGQTASRAEAPVQQTTAAAETLRFNMTDQAENIQKLSDLIKNAVDSQVKELEIQLEPANLGKITLKAVYESGKAAVIISCTNQAALEALSGKAAELGGILQERMGGQTEIIVEQPQQEYLDQDGRRGNQESREDQRQQQRQNSRPQTGDFLEQLRLGLI